MAGEPSTNMLRKLETMLQDVEAKPCALPLQLLKDITKQFSDELVIGRGGFGVVYKGVLGNGETVAVKKITIREANVSDVSEQFKNEVLSLLVAVKHQNIVRFLGYCSETHREFVDIDGKFVLADKQEKLLCLQYMPTGSLEKQITDESCGLEWQQRYKIIKGICRGIHYLHHLNAPIAHLDLKPANILLTNEMEPKITDFGLSRLFDVDQSQIFTKKVAGTRCYMAPECHSQTMLSKEADIFSLGIIVLEIITGKNYHMEITEASMQEDFVTSVLEKWRKRLSTPRRRSFLEKDCQQIKICTEIGLDCVKIYRKERPTSKDILIKLQVTDKDTVPQLDQLNLKCNAGCSRQNVPVQNDPSDNTPAHYPPQDVYQSSGSRCFACNEPIPAGIRFFTKDDKRYHEVCYKEHFNLKCVVCNNFLPSDSNGKIEWRVRPSGEKYCPSHDNNNRDTPSSHQVCSACNKPISAGTKFFTKDGKRYHEQCYKEHSNLKCVICKNFIPSDRDGKIRWGVRPSGEKYCLSHGNAGTSRPSRRS